MPRRGYVNYKIGREVVRRPRLRRTASVRTNQGPCGFDDDIDLSNMDFPKVTRKASANLIQAEKNKDDVEAAEQLNILSKIYVGTADWGHGVKCTRKLLEKAEITHNLIYKLKACKRLATASRAVGNMDLAVKYGEDCVALSHILTDPTDKIDILLDLVASYISRGDLYLDEATSAISRPPSSSAGPASANTNRSPGLADFECAKKHLASAMKLKNAAKLDAITKDYTVAKILLNYGILNKSSGFPQQGIDNITKACKIFLEQGELEDQAQGYFNLAVCYEMQGMYEKALLCVQTEQSIYSQLKDKEAELESIKNNARIVLKLRRFDDHRRLMELYLNKCKALDDKEMIDQAKEALNDAIEKVNTFNKIGILAKQIIDAQIRKQQRVEADLHGERGRLCLELEMIPEAILEFEAQLKLAKSYNATMEGTRTPLRDLAEACLLQKRYSDALRHTQEALKGDTANDATTLKLKTLLAQAHVGNGASYHQLVAICNEILQLAERLDDFDVQLDTLTQLKSLYVAFGYSDKVTTTMEKIEIVQAQIDALKADDSVPMDSLDDYGSIDSEAFEYEMSQPDENTPMQDASSSQESSSSDRVSGSTKRRQNVSSVSTSAVQKRTKPDARQRSKPSKNVRPDIVDLQSSDDEAPVNNRSAPREHRVREAGSRLHRDYPRSNAVLADQDSQSSDVAPVPTNRRQRVRSGTRLLIESSPDRSSPLSKPATSRRPTAQIDATGELGNLNVTATRLSSSPTSNPSLKRNLPRESQLAVESELRHEDPLISSPLPIPSSLLPLPSEPHQKTPSPTHQHALEVCQPTAPHIEMEIHGPKEQRVLVNLPCGNGPGGTPKTTAWLLSEARQRYRNIFKSPPPRLKLVVQAQNHRQQEQQLSSSSPSQGRVLKITDTLDDLVQDGHTRVSAVAIASVHQSKP